MRILRSSSIVARNPGRVKIMSLKTEERVRKILPVVSGLRNSKLL